MIAIAKVVPGSVTRNQAHLLTGPHADTVWVIPDKYSLGREGDHVLVSYEEQDQFAHPIDLKNVEKALKMGDQIRDTLRIFNDLFK